MTIGNWGRWGESDERGALNLLTPEVILEAVQSIKKGKVYSLALPIQQRKVPVAYPRNTAVHLMALDGGDYAAGARQQGKAQIADDYIFMATHGTTHTDALSHIWTEGKMYNGFSGNEVRSTSGARKCGVDKIDWIVARGIHFDLPKYKGTDHLESGYVITPDDLEKCAASQGVSLKPGDAVVLRTGWLNVFYKDEKKFYAGSPGIGMEAAKYLIEKDVCLVASDTMAVEVLPFEGHENGENAPVHIEMIRNYGIYLQELFDLNKLAEDQVYEFLYVAAPLKISGGVGSPLNPLAIS